MESEIANETLMCNKCQKFSKVSIIVNSHSKLNGKLTLRIAYHSYYHFIFIDRERVEEMRVD